MALFAEDVKEHIREAARATATSDRPPRAARAISPCQSGPARL